MNSNRCDSVRDRMESYLDGELNTAEHAALEAHCAGCASCARELVLARRVRDELRALPVFNAPQRTIAAAGRDIEASKVVRLKPRVSRRRVWTAVAAATVAVVAATVWVGTHPDRSAAPEFSDAEIHRASQELALAFGYVDHYSNQAAEIIHNDVLEKRVAPQIGRALNTSREAVIDDALVPGLRRALRESGSNVTSPPPGRS